MLRTQPNFLVHLAPRSSPSWLGLVLRLAPVEMALIVLTIALVLILECLNTALESICDLVSPGYHPLVKRAKDVSAAGRAHRRGGRRRHRRAALHPAPRGAVK